MITRHDNGDGTTTFRGVDVTIATSVAETHDVVEVRTASAGEWVVDRGSVYQSVTQLTGVYPIVTRRPTWTPPASLPAGKYQWDGVTIGNCDNEYHLPVETANRWLSDWSEPSNRGLWQVNEDGTATYLGEA